MAQYIRWQALLTLLGIGMTVLFLGYLAFNRPPLPQTRTVVISEMGGVYIEGVVGQPQFINPLIAQFNPVDQDLVALLFRGLTQPDGKGGVEPDLAESWEANEDGSAYVFRLKPGLKWQDGQPLTTADVIFTVRLLQDDQFPGLPDLTELWQTVTLQPLDDDTIRVVLTEPLPRFLDFTTIGLLPAHRLADMTSANLLAHGFNQRPIGNGPFRLQSLNAEVVRLVPNPFYHGESAQLEQLQLKFYPSYQDSLTAYQTDEVLGGHIPNDVLPLAEQVNGLNLYNSQQASLVLLYFNQESDPPFLAERTVRQAMSQILDKSALLTEALHGRGIVARNPFLSWSWAHHPNRPQPRYANQNATALFASVGWTDSNGDGILDQNGQSLAVTLLTSSEVSKVKVAEQMAQQWQAAGLSVTLEVVGAEFGERLRRGAYQVAIAELVQSGDPDPYPLWHSTQADGGQNYANWRNTRADQLLETGRQIVDRGPRTDAYYRFQEIFAEDVPAIPLYYPVYTYGVDDAVEGVQLPPLEQPSDRFRNVTDWHLITKRTVQETVPVGE